MKKRNWYLLGVIGLLLVITLFLVIKIILNSMGYDFLGWYTMPYFFLSIFF